MKEHPLIFSAPMVRAILAGRKSVTRRLADYSKWKQGERVWVRESFSAWFGGNHWRDTERFARVPGLCSNLFFRATHHFPDDDQRWIPSIHMPRWASRITLELTTDVRREKLNIGNIDYRAEGFQFQHDFFALWDQMHPDHPWKSNPVVSVIEFRKKTADES